MRWPNRSLLVVPLTGLALAACTSEAPVASEPEIARPAFNTGTGSCNAATVDSVAFNWGTSSLGNPDGSIGRAGTATHISEGLNVASSGGSPCDVLNFSGSTSTGAPLTVYRTTGKLGVGAATGTDDWISKTAQVEERLTVSLGTTLANRVATTAWVNLRGHNAETKAAVQPLLDGLPVGTEVLVDAGLASAECGGTGQPPCKGRAARIAASNGGVFNAIRIRATTTISVSVSGGSAWPAPVIAFKLSNISRCGTVCRLDWNSETNATSWVESFARNSTTAITRHNLTLAQGLVGPSTLMRFSTGAWVGGPRLGVTNDYINVGEALTVWLGSDFSILSVSTGRAATDAVLNLRTNGAFTSPATVQPMLDNVPVGAAFAVTAGQNLDGCEPKLPGVKCEGRQIPIKTDHGVLFNGIRITTPATVAVMGGSAFPRPALRFNFF